MTQVAPPSSGYTGEQYFRLVQTGALGPDDRVELLEGVVVAMSPHTPEHASAITLVGDALRAATGSRAVIRVQLPLLAGRRSAPEPDVAVVPGRARDYDRAHPNEALLVVEVSDASLAQDRLTKAAIYAGAGIPEYWIVNLRDACVEVLRAPDRGARRYTQRRVVAREESLDLLAFPGSALKAADLIPARESTDT